MKIECSLCGSTCREIADLGKQNLANNLTTEKAGEYPTHKLSLVICDGCGVQQLDGTIDPAIMFENYLWVTGTSKTTLDYLSTLADFCIPYKQRDAKVLEIASNDGSFLSCLRDRGWIVKGVDPAKNIAHIANLRGIETVPAFFNADYLVKNQAEKNYYDLIVARNVLPHSPNVREILTTAKDALSSQGKFLVEFHDAGLIHSSGHIDYIYHEHKYYFTYNSFVQLARSVGFSPIDYMRSPISGGSHVIVFDKSAPSVSSNSDAACEAKRYAAGDLQEVCERFCSRIANVVDSHEGSVIGFGASARASTLVNLIDENIASRLSVILDNSAHKNGHYFSRHKILIREPSVVKAVSGEELVLVFAWNFYSEIEDQLREIGFSKSQILNVKSLLD